MLTLLNSVAAKPQITNGYLLRPAVDFFAVARLQSRQGVAQLKPAADAASGVVTVAGVFERAALLLPASILLGRRASFFCSLLPSPGLLGSVVGRSQLTAQITSFG